jgi:hypothetical protein
MAKKALPLSLSDLPIDILIHGIWPYLTQLDVLRRAQFVSKLWRQNIFKSIKVLDFRTKNSLETFKLRVFDLGLTTPQSQASTSIKFLNMIPAETVEKLKIEISMAGFGNLIKAHIVDQALRFLCNRFTSLREVDLLAVFDEKFHIDIDHPLLQLKQLASVHFDGSPERISDAAWASLAPRITSLKVKAIDEKRLLQLSNVSSIQFTGNALDLRILSNLAKLKVLECDWSSVDSVDSAVATHADHFDVVTGLTSFSFFSWFGNFPNLTAISATLRRLKLSHIKTKAAIELPRLPLLVDLSLHFCSAEFVSGFTSSLEELRSLDIFGDATRTYQIPEIYWKKITKVTRLLLGGVHVDHKISFRRNIPDLRYFEFYSFTSLPVKISKALRGASSLRNVVLRVCRPQASDFDWLIKRAPTLESLAIYDFMVPIGDFILPVLSKLEQISSLELKAANSHHFPRDTPAGTVPVAEFREAIRGLVNLRYLVVENVLLSRQQKQIEQLEVQLKRKYDHLSIFSFNHDKQGIEIEDDDWEDDDDW